MADHSHVMADHSHAHQGAQVAPLTPEAFLADRLRFWSTFTHFVVFSAGSVILLLVLLAIFLL